jgi:hypothetical protein
MKFHGTFLQNGSSLIPHGAASALAAPIYY